MNVWEEAILKTYDLLGGNASNQEIYENVGRSIPLRDDHLKPTVYGGRPAYVHQIRSHIANLVQSGDLNRVDRGRYRLTGQGQRRVKP